MRRAEVAVCGLGVVVLLAGCGPVPGGPATIDGTAAQLCTTVPAGGDEILGAIVKVPEGADIVVTKVFLVDPVDLDYVDAKAMIDITEAVASLDYRGDDYWQHFDDAIGAEFGAGYSELLVHVRRTGADSSAQAIGMEYGSGGVAYRTQGTTSFLVRDDCDHLDDDG